MNHLEKFKKLKNTYVIIRHGESFSNTQGIIVSDPRKGVEGFGLTDKGKEQVQKSINSTILNKESIIVSSDFLRAKKTAQIVQEKFGNKEIIFDEKLRERYFGKLDGEPVGHFQMIWDLDKENKEENHLQIETITKVQERVTKLITELENKFQEKEILLVSHGDTLQILQTAFLKIPPQEHQKIEYILNAEIRQLHLKE